MTISCWLSAMLRALTRFDSTLWEKRFPQGAAFCSKSANPATAQIVFREKSVRGFILLYPKGAARFCVYGFHDEWVGLELHMCGMHHRRSVGLMHLLLCFAFLDIPGHVLIQVLVRLAVIDISPKSQADEERCGHGRHSRRPARSLENLKKSRQLRAYRRFRDPAPDVPPNLGTGL